MTPEQWAREAMESAVKHGSMETAIAAVVRAAIADALILAEANFRQTRKAAP